VLVFFTDGWPNIIQDSLTCPPAVKGGKSTTANLLYCGCDPGDISLGLCGSKPIQFFDPTTCNSSSNNCNAPKNACKATTFPDQQTGTAEELNDVNFCGGTNNAQSDAMYRAIQVAAGTAGPGGLWQSQNVYVYSIGMGNAITGQPLAIDFLKQVANDPGSSKFDSTKPVGEAVFATDASALPQVFQTIASKVLLRLSQ
jgi:hypothetical protein